MIKSLIDKLDPDIVNASYFVGCISLAILIVGLILMSCDDRPPTIKITEENLVKMLRDARNDVP